MWTVEAGLAGTAGTVVTAMAVPLFVPIIQGATFFKELHRLVASACIVAILLNAHLWPVSSTPIW